MTGAGRRRPPTSDKDQLTLATIGLVAVTLVWGGTFVAVRDAIAEMPVLPFLFWRFLLAAIVLAMVRPGAVFALSRQQCMRGVLLGILLGGGYMLQTFGLETVSATVSGFITGMVVVFTPLLSAVITRKPLTLVGWASTAIATVGLGLLTINGALHTPGRGEWLTMAAALAFAGHVVGLSRWSTSGDAYGLTVVQLTVVTLIGLLGSFLQGGPALPPDGAVWATVIFLAVAATAMAFLTQTWAQTKMSAHRAAIVLTMEPVFAGVFGVAIGGDALTWRIVAGGVLILLAMYVVELAPQRSLPASARSAQEPAKQLSSLLDLSDGDVEVGHQAGRAGS